MPNNPQFGIWAIKGGDQQGRSGFLTIDEALAYAAIVPPSGVVSGCVTVYPSAFPMPTIPTVPANVLLEVIDKGTRTLYGASGIINASGRVRRIREFGGVGDGVADDTAAIMQAWASLPPFIGGVLDFEDGRWRHTSQLLFDSKRTKCIGFNSDVVYNTTPGCKIIKDYNSGTTAGIVFMQDRSGMEGIAYVGVTGRTGDGVQLLNNTCFLRACMIANMGRDGCWLGDNSATSGTYNLNCWYIEDTGFVSNGRDGLFMSCRDNAGGGNCNAGVATRVACNLNGRNGVRIRDAGKNAWVGLLTESNTNEGIYILGMGHQNLFFGGDNEGNFPTDTPTPSQIKISNEEGAGHTPISCAFYDVGVNAGYRIVDQGLHTRFYQDDYPFPMPNALVGRISTNAPAGVAPAIPTSPAGSGIYHALSDQGGERLRVGIVSDVAGMVGSLLAAQIMADTASTLWLVARSSHDNAVVKIATGTAQGHYLQVSSAGVETNKNVNIVGGAVLKVGGTQVVQGRGAAVTAPTGGTVIDTQSRTAINDLIARLQAHGLIS